MKPQWPTILICGLLLTAAQPSWARKWTDNKGKFSVEAELLEVKDDNVVLKRTNGSVITVPLARLSENDRQYLRTLAQEPINEPARPRAEVIAAWQKATAETGWILQRQDLVFVGSATTSGRPVRLLQRKPKARRRGLAGIPFLGVPNRRIKRPSAARGSFWLVVSS